MVCKQTDRLSCMWWCTIPDRSAVYLQCSGVYTASTLLKLNSVAAVYTDHAVYYTLQTAVYTACTLFSHSNFWSDTLHRPCSLCTVYSAVTLQLHCRYTALRSGNCSSHKRRQTDGFLLHAFSLRDPSVSSWYHWHSEIIDAIIMSQVRCSHNLWHLCPIICIQMLKCYPKATSLNAPTDIATFKAI